MSGLSTLFSLFLVLLLEVGRIIVTDVMKPSPSIERLCYAQDHRSEPFDAVDCLSNLLLVNRLGFTFV